MSDCEKNKGLLTGPGKNLKTVRLGAMRLWALLVRSIRFLYAEPEICLLEVGVAGYLAGIFLFPNAFFHNSWLLFTIAIPVYRWRTQELNSKVYDDVGFWLLVALLSSMLASSIFVSSSAMHFGNVFFSLVDAGGILCLYAGVSIIVRSRWQSSARLLTAFPVAGALVMLISVPVFYWILPEHPFPTARLRNVLVHSGYGGLHQVLTGLLCGAAAMSAACLFSNRAHLKRQLLWLTCFSVLTASLFLTHSRGAILALLVSFAVYVFTRMDRSWVMPTVILAVIGLIYAFPNDPKVDDLSSLTTSPVTQLIERGDGGRFTLYKHLFSRMDGFKEILLGKGLWANSSASQEQVGWSVAFHPHSIYMATFYHGGLIALCMTVGILAYGTHRAYCLYRATGNGTWLVLVTFGLTGQIVDGSLPFSLMTVPRIEPLLVLLPMAGSSAAWCEYVRNAALAPSTTTNAEGIENRL